MLYTHIHIDIGDAGIYLSIYLSTYIGITPLLAFCFLSFFLLRYPSCLLFTVFFLCIWLLRNVRIKRWMMTMNDPNFIGLLWGLNKITCMKCLAQYMAHSKHLINANSIVMVMAFVIKFILPWLIVKIATYNTRLNEVSVI